MTAHKKTRQPEEKSNEQDQPHEEGQHNRKNKDIKLIIAIALIILGFVLVILLVPWLSKLIGTGTGNYPQYDYNGFTFRQIGGLWYTEIQPGGSSKLFEVPLHFGPKSLEDIPVSGNVDRRFYSNETYLTADIAQDRYNALSAAEISFSIVQVFGITPIAACSGKKINASGCQEIPVINCENTNQSVIYFEESDKTQVILQGNCVRIQGKEMELVRATDRFLLHWFGIMKPK